MKIKAFRTKLQQILDIASKKDTPYFTTLAAVIRTLKADYDFMWPPEIYDKETSPCIQDLVGKYCESDIKLCPICSSKLVERKGKTASFLGCSRFPNCKGTRDLIGKVVLSEALKDFLLEKSRLEEVSDTKNIDRFTRMDNE